MTNTLYLSMMQYCYQTAEATISMQLSLQQESNLYSNNVVPLSLPTTMANKQTCKKFEIKNQRIKHTIVYRNTS